MRLKYGDFKTIYFGSSRIQTGLPTDNNWVDKATTYNAGIPGTNMYELQEIINYSLKYQQPETVFYSVDFLAFSSARTTSADYDASLFASEWNLVPALARYLLSFDSLERAINTFIANIKGEAPSDSNEMNNCDGTRVILRIKDQRKMFQTGLGKMYEKGGVYNCYNYTQDRIDSFRSSLVALLESDVSVAIYMSPVHAFQLLGIESAGLLPTFNQWRRDISDVVSELKKDPELGDRLIAAWDFTLPLGVNIETVSSLPDDVMIGYFNSDHHTHLIGSSVINSLMENRLVDDQLKGYQLGVASSNANIDLLYEQLNHYKDTHPEIVTEVIGIHEKYSSKTACRILP